MAFLALRFSWFDELLNIVENPEYVEYIQLVQKNPNLMKGMIMNKAGKKQEIMCS
ncbi:MAG: hypothetical protein R3240_13955 [Gammaproteobacteria bacterium]|nr:hypothetical protein [Gammaproteobacteria bacterium]